MCWQVTGLNSARGWASSVGTAGTRAIMPPRRRDGKISGARRPPEHKNDSQPPPKPSTGPITTALLLQCFGFGQPNQTEELTSTLAQRWTLYRPGDRPDYGALPGSGTPSSYAIALPENTGSTSLIGQFRLPIANGSDAIGNMDSNVLSVCPGGKGGVIASFRQAIDKDNMPEVTGRFKVRPLA
ncbi:hypothetical protein MAPG_09188 [Magnaporthiopsis poae ATCC 64411]|uniref:Uncharacterized protein n=1 Tax=Magnaporthiopsis poae (strain ATCC 64411 / 73-15) TaxID=644358 RepID=A0A0C4E9A9_MAGP6|nr:hypothetical protein MAPG_09188 [Magnaporthiopsis poae ATCC 64411]